MQAYAAQLEKMRSVPGYWAERIVSQLRYAAELSRLKESSYDELIGQAVDFLQKQLDEEGAITRATAQQTEQMLEPLAVAAKEYEVICAAHAHIDMNWMWGYAETAAVALDTFQTMLNLMEEYPEFTFSQSQASVYQIVEEYRPEMLDQIRQRIREGRWEVTASTWVEADKNMPVGESHTRHILYTKRYLSKLLGLDPHSLQIDFEPDTFGHSRNVPEILSRGGIRYYYHCRGYEGHTAYLWKAPSGSTVIAYREPVGYNAGIEGNTFVMTPSCASSVGLKTMLKVYGVGDHGGGPTRRDVERIIDMSSWPIFPRFRFGTFREYFKMLESIRDSLPVVDRELNFAFSGCYTTQTRIKLSNRYSESRLYSAEAWSSMAAQHAAKTYPGKMYENAWRKTLFNQFHDILTGSGVIETREYAMGQFQQVLTAANTGYISALREIAAQVDTTFLPEDGTDREDMSEGAGVGFAVSDYGIPQSERGRGKNRVLHFFNPSAWPRKELAEATLWDWPGNLDRMQITGSNGEEIPFQFIDGKAQQLHPAGAFWGHRYVKLLLEIEVPAMGYTTCRISEKQPETCPLNIETWDRTETVAPYVMENDFVRVEFDTESAAVKSFYDKRSGRELVPAGKHFGVFRFVEEDTEKGMTSWIVGRYKGTQELLEHVKVLGFCGGKDHLRQWIKYQIPFRSSVLSVTVSLDRMSAGLQYRAECDWHELPEKGVMIPQLNFSVPLPYTSNSYLYDVPFGTISREAMEMDVPANSWGLALPTDRTYPAIKITTDNKYGFRGTGDSFNVTLIRSSYDPDPYPESGIEPFCLWVEAVPSDQSRTNLIRTAFDHNHAIGFVSGRRHGGVLPLSEELLSLNSENAVLSAVKIPEDSDGNELLIRLYETEGKNGEALLRLAKPVHKAWCTDINEEVLGKELEVLEGNQVRVPVPAGTVQTVRVLMGGKA